MKHRFKSCAYAIRKAMFYLIMHSTHILLIYRVEHIKNHSDKKPSATTWATLFDSSKIFFVCTIPLAGMRNSIMR